MIFIMIVVINIGIFMAILYKIFELHFYAFCY